MLFVVLQVRQGVQVLKQWCGRILLESGTLANVFDEYSSGVLNKPTLLPYVHHACVEA